MKWEKRGLIYCPNGQNGWDNQFAMLPTPLLISQNRLRIFLGFCDKKNIGRIGYVDVNPQNPSEIIEVSEKPILDKGTKGCFDDNGAVPISLVKNNNEIYLYYIGFQLGIKVPYYMFCGLAISNDGGYTFKRYSKVPILDRTAEDLYARCGSFVMKDNNTWRMWYIGSLGEGWTEKNGKQLPLYTMKYLESKNGINWENKSDVFCLEFKNSDEHGFGRPFVFKENNIFKMYYSIRTYSRGYYIGYAESKNGINWTRLDDKSGIDVSERGWDSENISYPWLYKYNNKTYMFYNGNGCGKTGFGYAEMIEE